MTICAQRNPLTLTSCGVERNPPFITWVPRDFSIDSRVSVSRKSDERFYTLRLSYATRLTCGNAHNDERCLFLNANAERGVNLPRVGSFSTELTCSMQHASTPAHSLEISSGDDHSGHCLFFGPASHRRLNLFNQQASCRRFSDGHYASSTHRVFRSPNCDRCSRSLGRHHCSVQVDLAPSCAAAVPPELHALFRGRCRVFLAPAVFSFPPASTSHSPAATLLVKAAIQPCRLAGRPL